MDHSTNVQTLSYPPLPQPQTLPQLMNHSTNAQTLSYPPLAQPQTSPQLMYHTTNTQTSQPQIALYTANPQDSALASAAPVEDDCTECAVTEYKKYNLTTPFARGLPERSVFICTLCGNNFSREKSLQRHMKNIHGAFDQIEKGEKRKLKRNETYSKKVKTSQELVPYMMYGNST